VFLGRHLFSAVVGVDAVLGARRCGAGVCGGLSGITARNLPRWAEKSCTTGARDCPDERLAAKVAAIADGPGRATSPAGGDSELGARAGGGVAVPAIRAGRTIRHLQELWPNLQCFVHGGVPVGPFVGELRAALGPT